RDPTDSGALRTEMQQLEGRIAARLQADENAVAELRRSWSEAILSMRAQIAAMQAEFATVQSHAVAGSGEVILDGAATDRVRNLERRLDEFRRHHAQFERTVAADLVDIEQGLKAQGVAIESSRTAMSQTDELVVSVVEALE